MTATEEDYRRAWRAGCEYGREMERAQALYEAAISLIRAGLHDSEAFRIVDAMYEEAIS